MSLSKAPIKNNFVFGKIILGFSGGVDSVVLLDLLLQLLPKKNIILAHLNHNFRAKESDHDEQFVKKLAQKNNLKIITKKLKKAPHNENEARQLRYEFLNQIKEKNQANFIALAHHQSDQIETLLLQLTRGTAYLHPMKELSVDYKWRPLLNFTKEDIYKYAQNNKLSWREDSTNKKNIYSRNLLRNEVCPKLHKINPAFSNNILQFGQNSYENYLLIKSLAQNFLKKFFDGDSFSRDEFLKLKDPIKKHVLKIINKNLYSNHISEILTLIKNGIGNKKKHGFILNKGKITIDFFVNQFLILASKSPQRKKILEEASYNFIDIDSKYPEIWQKNKSINQNILLFSEKKASAIYKKYPNNTIVACDTIVVHPQNGVYFKPKNKEDAFYMLKSYSNTTIKILSALCIIKKSEKFTEIVETEIEFKKLSDTYLKELINKKDFWQERCGGFSISQIKKSIKNIKGCFFNILGLPIQKLNKFLKFLH